MACLPLLRWTVWRALIQRLRGSIPSTGCLVCKKLGSKLIELIDWFDFDFDLIWLIDWLIDWFDWLIDWLIVKKSFMCQSVDSSVGHWLWIIVWCLFSVWGQLCKFLVWNKSLVVAVFDSSSKDWNLTIFNIIFDTQKKDAHDAWWVPMKLGDAVAAVAASIDRCEGRNLWTQSWTVVFFHQRKTRRIQNKPMPSYNTWARPRRNSWSKQRRLPRRPAHCRGQRSPHPSVCSPWAGQLFDSVCSPTRTPTCLNSCRATSTCSCCATRPANEDLSQP